MIFLFTKKRLQIVQEGVMCSFYTPSRPSPFIYWWTLQRIISVHPHPSLESFLLCCCWQGQAGPHVQQAHVHTPVVWHAHSLLLQPLPSWPPLDLIPGVHSPQNKPRLVVVSDDRICWLALSERMNAVRLIRLDIPNLCFSPLLYPTKCPFLPALANTIQNIHHFQFLIQS